ncbi:hypothetical protein D623_10035382 [Myotis brandtii]|uniref:Uncharacterized protein n=1 Tax=Myotis brandtii TaxID=109478 RepID=S7MMI3_MYOBR|nr:hypothetical protein D623_10035382 [Myotis brandtii]
MAGVGDAVMAVKALPAPMGPDESGIMVGWWSSSGCTSGWPAAAIRTGMSPRLENAPSIVWIMSPPCPCQTLGLSQMSTSLGLWGSELPSGRGQARQPPPFSCPWSLTPSRNLYNQGPPPKVLDCPLLFLRPSNSRFFTSPLRAGPGRSSLLHPWGSNSSCKRFVE